MMTAWPSSARVLIKGARVYDHSGDVHEPCISDILISDGKIQAIAPEIAASPGVGSVDARGKLIVPGFVNAHYHSHDVLAKGMFEDVPFDVWTLQANPNHFGRRSLREIRLRTLIGAVENLRNGITTVQDMLTLVPQEEEYLDCILSAYQEAGIRVVLSVAARDLSAQDIAPFIASDVSADVRRRIVGVNRAASDELDFVKRQLLRHPAKSGALQSWALGPSAPQRCSPELLEGMAALSREFNLPVLTHLYETRIQAAAAHQAGVTGSLIERLDQAGLLNDKLSIAHGVWLSPTDIARLAENGVGVVSNPVSNLALKSGVAPIDDLSRAGVGVAIGCDNYSCAHTQNVFVSMRMLCLLASITSPEPGAINAAYALRSATMSGARSVGLEGQVGELKEGMQADLMIIDLSEPAFVPMNSAARQIVYAECGRAIETVLVAGRPVVLDGRMTTVDEAALAAEAAELLPEIKRSAVQASLQNAELMPAVRDAIKRAWNVDIGIERYVGGGRRN